VTVGLIVATLVLGQRVMFKNDPDNDPILGSAASADAVDSADRAAARLAAPGPESMMLSVYRPIASLARSGNGWASVTPAAIGKAVDTVGVLAADSAPNGTNEVSLAVDPVAGIILGTIDVSLAKGACVWLRDMGPGPEVVHVTRSTTCAAIGAPTKGWTPIQP
jgi:hypothetical protein